MATLLNPEGQLSEHFHADEFRCHCGCGQTRVDERLVAALEELRAVIGVPIGINCGYRCPKHNAATPGAASNSQHVYGRAADVRAVGKSPDEVATAAETIPAFRMGGIGRYKTFTHVDVRNGPARWDQRKERGG